MSWYQDSKERMIPRKFEPSAAWMQLYSFVRTAAIPDGFTPAEPEAYEQALAGKSQWSGPDIDRLFKKHNPGQNMRGFDSLYIGPSGSYYLLHPHTHDMTAYEVIRGIHGNSYQSPTANPAHKFGGITHTDLSHLSGIMRIQIYGNGMGVTIDMNHPPTPAQLEAIRQVYMRTLQEKFVAEITLNGTTLRHLTSYEDLVDFVNNYAPPRSEDQMSEIERFRSMPDYYTPGRGEE